ncbi:MAG: hypothetical protein KIS61_36235 [Candidatus Eremiobacteraeota bacterium]|nr:hypothetical protein [Candidatus Eremiobacteraeota bacterium]
MIAWKGKARRLALAVLFTWGLLELLLRLTAPYLGPRVSTELFRSYSIERCGIYLLDPLHSIQFMWPNRHTRCMVNGYAWSNDTDERGLRNPRDCASDILVFGDSFLYGHGVELADSAVDILRRKYGWKVYNMARQGDSIYQQYTLFRLYFDILKPRHLILCPFANDFQDIEQVRSPQEQLQPMEFKPDYVDEVRSAMHSPEARTPRGNWFTTSYAYRLVAMLGRKDKADGGFQPPANEAVREERFQRQGYFYALLFQDLVTRARAAGCTVDVVYMDTAENRDAYWSVEQERIGKYFAWLCARSRVPFYSTRELLQGHPEYLLPHDGHLSPLGNQAFAALVARECPKTWASK